MFSLKEESKKNKTILFITCALFFIICIFSIFHYGNSTLLGSLDNPDNDDVKFIRSAWLLKETGNYYFHNPGTATAFMMPGLPFSLAFFMNIFGKLGGITAFRIVQAIFQTASLCLVFFIARKIFNSKVAIIAVIINALCIADYWVTNLILTESIFKFFLLLLVYLSIYAIEEKKTKYYILGGIAWGFGTLFRPTIAAFPIIILIMWIYKKYTFKEMIKYGLIVSVIFCIILSPWWIRNYSIFHKFIPLTEAQGNPMLQGTFINYDQSTKATDGLDYSKFPYTLGTEIDNNKVDIEVSKYRLRELVPEKPLEFLVWYTVGKTYYQLRWPFVWTEFLHVPFWFAGILHYLILIFAVIGIKRYYKKEDRNKMANMILATIIFFILAYLPFYAFERYFYPAMPFAIMFAAYGVWTTKFYKLKGLI